MRKPFITDGLVQIAIVLSLLRTDLNSYFRHNYVEYPEVQEIVLGQGVAYTQTNFHNIYNTYQRQPEILRKDIIENDYSWTSPVFRELRSFRNIDNLRQINVPTYLIVQGGPPMILEPSQNQDTDENANSIEPEPGSTAPPEAEVLSSLGSLTFDENFDETFSSIFSAATDPTSEDLDLIEVLWRQDIDLGAGKEAYDLNLRQELEREREIELQKEKQKQKEADLQQQKLEDQQRQNQQRWLADNFTQDGETGEWVPLGARVPPPPPAPNLLPDGDQSFLSTFDNVPMLSEQYCQESTNSGFNNNLGSMAGSRMQPQPQNSYQGVVTQVSQSLPQQLHQQQQQQQQAPPMYNSHQHHNQLHQQQQQQQHQHQQCQQQQLHQQQQQGFGHQRYNVSSQIMQNGYTNTSTVSSYGQPQPTPQTGYVDQMQPFRQNSVEQAWQDLVNVLDLPQANQSMNGSQDNSSLMMVARGLQSSLDNSTSSVLIQNATLPNMNNNNNNLTGFADSGLVSPTPSSTDVMHSPCSSNGVMSPSQSCNSSLGTAGGMNPMEWSSPGYLFSNITNNLNQTESLEDVDELLPDLITDEDELEDINFSELGLGDGMTPTPGNNDASSDSAVSMGSPNTDFSDAMSPLDDTVEGATGGEGYQSSGIFSKTSKYDPDDYKYSSSCSYGYGDNSSNFSSSSNDTDSSGHFNPTKNGNMNNMNRNINHNHTYPQTPGKEPKDIKKTMYGLEKPRHKGPHCRDAKRIEELNIPFTVDQIVNSPVEEFNDMLTRHKLSEPQLQLIRDIRRRGKNKVAAQNCRKRKMDVIGTLEEEMLGLERMRDKLLHERHLIDKHTREMKEKFGLLYTEIFQSLRDEHGRPYDPNRYSLQQSSDGDVFLVPRNFTSEDDPNKKRKNERKYE